MSVQKVKETGPTEWIEGEGGGERTGRPAPIGPPGPEAAVGAAAGSLLGVRSLQRKAEPGAQVWHRWGRHLPGL